MAHIIYRTGAYEVPVAAPQELRDLAWALRTHRSDQAQHIAEQIVKRMDYVDRLDEMNAHYRSITEPT